jgi:hypothetical protein
MIKVTEEKLLAFELFLNHQKLGSERAFGAFTIPQECLDDKAVFDVLEEDNCADAIASFLRRTD